MLIKGDGYLLENVDVVRYVDDHYPHAIVEPDGTWYADKYPHFKAPVQSCDKECTVTVFSADAKYYAGLVPSMLSFREHHPESHIVILDRGLTSIQCLYLAQYAEIVQSNNCVPEIEAWGRFEVSLLKYQRIIYLDSDIIVLKPLTDMHLTHAEFAAVKNLDWKVTENFSEPSVLERYGIPPDLPAFFAGGFSIDNKVWGNGRLLEAANRIYAESGKYFLYGDQSALQIVMYEHGHRITYLGDEYNAIAECWDWENKSDLAYVIHYAGDAIKPWHPTCNYPMLHIFFKYSKIPCGKMKA